MSTNTMNTTTAEHEPLPTIEEFRAIKRERCRRKLAAEHTKALAAAVVDAFGADAARPVLASRGNTVDDVGAVRSLEEDEVDRDWAEVVAVMYPVHGTRLKLPCDTWGPTIIGPESRVKPCGPGVPGSDGQRPVRFGARPLVSAPFAHRNALDHQAVRESPWCSFDAVAGPRGADRTGPRVTMAGTRAA